MSQLKTNSFITNSDTERRSKKVQGLVHQDTSHLDNMVRNNSSYSRSTASTRNLSDTYPLIGSLNLPAGPGPSNIERNQRNDVKTSKSQCRHLQDHERITSSQKRPLTNFLRLSILWSFSPNASRLSSMPYIAFYFLRITGEYPGYGTVVSVIDHPPSILYIPVFLSVNSVHPISFTFSFSRS